MIEKKTNDFCNLEKYKLMFERRKKLNHEHLAKVVKYNYTTGVEFCSTKHIL